MFELSVVEHPQTAGFIYLPSTREQLYAQIVFLHPIRNATGEISTNLAIRRQTDRVTTSYIARPQDQIFGTRLFGLTSMPDAGSKDRSLRMLGKQSLYLVEEIQVDRI